MTSPPKLLVILGPTSTGKTDLALWLAKRFSGELVSCDSRQVYTGLDIGTGKRPSELKIKNLKLKIEKGDGWWNIDGIKVWMYDVVDFKKQYTVADYVEDANQVIDRIISRSNLPIIVGGTGLYLKALLEGLPNLEIPLDEKLRKKLEKLSKEELQEKLQKVSPDRWNKLNESDRQNPRRLIRAIEIVTNSKPRLPIGQVKAQNYSILKIGLNAPREILYQRADERVEVRIKAGMVGEAMRLYKNGLSLERMRRLGLEYGVIAEFFEGNTKTMEEFVEILKYKIHGFIRRQLTWFKKERKINWIDITDKNYLVKVENLITKWYDNVVDLK